MTTQTPAPNDDTPREPSPPSAGRNDYGIDPNGEQPIDPGAAPAQGDDEVAKDNAFSPDFAPEEDPEAQKSSVPKDADIDTDGG